MTPLSLLFPKLSITVFTSHSSYISRLKLKNIPLVLLGHLQTIGLRLSRTTISSFWADSRAFTPPPPSLVYSWSKFNFPALKSICQSADPVTSLFNMLCNSCLCSSVSTTPNLSANLKEGWTDYISIMPLAMSVVKIRRSSVGIQVWCFGEKQLRYRYIMESPSITFRLSKWCCSSSLRKFLAPAKHN